MIRSVTICQSLKMNVWMNVGRKIRQVLYERLFTLSPYYKSRHKSLDRRDLCVFDRWFLYKSDAFTWKDSAQYTFQTRPSVSKYRSWLYQGISVVSRSCHSSWDVLYCSVYHMKADVTQSVPEVTHNSDT